MLCKGKGVCYYVTLAMCIQKFEQVQKSMKRNFFLSVKIYEKIIQPNGDLRHRYIAVGLSYGLVDKYGMYVAIWWKSTYSFLYYNNNNYHVQMLYLTTK